MPDAAFITAVIPDPRQPRRVLVQVGGRVVARLSGKLAGQLGLSAGQRWEEDLARRVGDAVAYDRVLSATTRWLGRRPRSRAQVQARLESRGVAPPMVQRLMQRLEELGLLDDAALGRELIAQITARRPAGAALLAAKLVQRGLSEELAQRLACEAGADPARTLAQALALARRRQTPWAGLPQASQARRLAGLLARRGFEEDIIHDVLAELGLGGDA